jgi:hypothetical protein
MIVESTLDFVPGTFVGRATLDFVPGTFVGHFPAAGFG